jgi:hypothetical protein
MRWVSPRESPFGPISDRKQRREHLGSSRDGKFGADILVNF